jgi:hypothetical protein
MQNTIMRKSFIYTIAICIPLFLALICLEFISRKIDGIPVFSKINFVSQALSAATKSGASEYHETLGWTLRSNFGNSTFSTREHGIRLNVNDAAGELETLRRDSIVVVGDSFAAGSEVSNANTWPAFLDRHLDVHVYNGAAGGYGVDQIYLRSLELNKLLSPSIIIFGILTNDSLRNVYSIYGGGHKPYFTIEETGELNLQGVPVPRPNVGKARDVGVIRSILGHSYLIYFVVNTLNIKHLWITPSLHYKKVASNEVGVEITCGLLKKIKLIEDSVGVDYLFFPQYGYGEVKQGERHWFGRDVVDCAKKLGVEMVDPWEYLSSQVGNGLIEKHYVLQADGVTYGHMSDFGNEQMGEILLSYLSRKIGK